jgi:hypothetical protein
LPRQDGARYGYVIGVVVGTLIVYFGKRILQPETTADERR